MLKDKKEALSTTLQIFQTTCKRGKSAGVSERMGRDVWDLVRPTEKMIPGLTLKNGKRVHLGVNMEVGSGGMPSQIERMATE